MDSLPHLLVPDSSAKALMAQQRSSSSPTFSIDSPIESCVPVVSPSSPSPNICSPQVDLSLPSSSSNLVPEIQPVAQSKSSRRRQKEKQQHAHKIEEHLNRSCREKRISGTDRGSADFQKKRRGCQDNMCCKCAAAFTADCAAVCCCPLALLHLAALAFIRLPMAVAWKMLVSLKEKISTKRRSTKKSEEDSPRTYVSTWSWSNGSSFKEGRGDLGVQTFRFDGENLWQDFEGSDLDFGGSSMKKREVVRQVPTSVRASP